MAYRNVTPMPREDHTDRDKMQTIYFFHYFISSMHKEKNELQKTEMHKKWSISMLKHWRSKISKTKSKQVTYLFRHSFSSWFRKLLRGNSWLQCEHSVGSSEIVFSTARLREQMLRLISVRQFGQVGCSFLSRLSARRWVKHEAHMRCPFRH